MLSRKLKNDKILIFWNDKYYVVNDFTCELLDYLDKSYSLNKIMKLTGLNEKQIKKNYKDIENLLINREYYSENLLLDMPIKVQWKITNYCNLHCQHCYLGDIDGQSMNYDDSLKIVDQIINSNVMEVTLSGGECLTYKGIDKIVLKLLLSGIKVNIFTNGLLLNNFITLLSKSKQKIDKKDILFYVSVDGMKESHEQIRGKKTFDLTISNIKYAIDNGYTVVTNTVVNSKNYNDITNLITLLKTIGVKDVQLSNLIVQGRAKKDMLATNKEQLQIKDNIKELYKSHPEYGIIYYSEVPDEDGIRKVYSIDGFKEEYIGKDNWSCTAGVARVTIDSCGKVYCCPFLKNSYLGNLRDNTLEEIWKSKNRFKFLKMIANVNTGRVCLAMKNNKKGEFND